MVDRTGVFLVVEGIDGVGKSTLLREIGGILLERGLPVVFTSEPEGWTKLGSDVKHIVETYQLRDELTRFLLLSAARNEHVALIEKWLKDKVVLCDRYYDSSFAYQLSGENAAPREVVEMVTQAIVTPQVEPDIKVYVTLQENVGHLRNRMSNPYEEEIMDRSANVESIYELLVVKGTEFTHVNEGEAHYEWVVWKNNGVMEGLIRGAEALADKVYALWKERHPLPNF